MYNDGLDDNTFKIFQDMKDLSDQAMLRMVRKQLDSNFTDRDKVYNISTLLHLYIQYKNYLSKKGGDF